MLPIQVPNFRRTRGKSQGRMVDVRRGQTDDLEEPSHKVETILCGVEKGMEVDGPSNLSLSHY